MKSNQVSTFNNTSKSSIQIMATEASLSIPIHLQPHHHLRRPPTPVSPFPQTQSTQSLSLLASHSTTPSPSPSYSPLQTGLFLTNDELQKLDLLINYSCHQDLESGLLWVRAMREEEMDLTVSLLSESLAESMIMAGGYDKMLEFLVKNYHIEFD